MHQCFNPRPAFARGATACVDGSAFTARCFNPRPAFARGATALVDARDTMDKFQSAPRVRTRGDCGPANRQSRKPLLLDFREHREFSRVRSDSVVKELCKGSSFNALVEER